MKIKFDYQGDIFNDDQELLEKIKKEIKKEIPIKTIMQYIANNPDYGEAVWEDLAEMDEDLYDKILAGVVKNWIARDITVIVEP